MATGIAPPDGNTAAKKSAKKMVACDQFIDRQLRRTRGQVKSLEVALGVMGLAVGALAFFLIAVVLDHWVLRGGLGSVGRWLSALVLAGGIGYLIVKFIWPAVFGRVNPIYAAHTIERSRPALKNSLINFLLFRQNREHVPPVLFNALEEQAARGLAKTPLEHAVDRTRLIHLGYVLLALVVAFALYFVLSPKNPLVTVGRVMLPWTDIPAPARVSILDVRPGSGTAFRGQPLEVSAEIAGMASDDDAKVLWTTADRQVFDQPIVLHLPANGYRHAAMLPDPKGGLQQDIEYRLVAGDATSPTYHVHVVPAPTIVVDSVDYKYPAYTKLQPGTIEHRGDLKAIEGTQITLHAVANQPLKAASIDFNCDGKLDGKMKLDGQNASITFTLLLNETRTGPQFESYQLRSVNNENLQNPQPIKHSIKVVPDLPPDVSFLAPEQEEVAVPLDGQLVLELRAIDPDFALTDLKIRGKTDRGMVFDQRLLPESPHTGPFFAKYQFEPAKLGLKEGDVVRYQAVADDNKEPEANETATPERRIRIVGAENLNPRRQPDPLAKNDQPNNQPQNPNDNARNDGQPQQQNQGNNSKTDRTKGQRPENDRPQERNAEKNDQNNQPDRGNPNREQRQQRDNDPQQRNDQPQNGGQKQDQNQQQQPPQQNKNDQPQQPKDNDRQGGAQNSGDNQNNSAKSQDKQSPDQKNQSQPNNNQQQADQKNQQKSGGNQSDKNENGQQKNQDGNKGGQQDGSKGGQQSNSGGQKSNSGGQQQNSNNQPDGGSKSDASKSDGGQQNAGKQDQNNPNNRDGSQQPGGKQNDGQKQNSSAQQDGKQSDGKGQSNGPMNSQQQNSGEANQNGHAGQGNQNGEKSKSGEKNDANENQSPVPADGSDDGRAVEKILSQQDKQQPGAGQPQNDSQPKPNSQAADNQQQNANQQPGSQQPQADKGQSAGGQKQDGDAQKQGDKTQTGNQQQPGVNQKPDSQRQPGANQPGDNSATPDGKNQSGDPSSKNGANQQQQPNGQPGANQQPSADQKQPGDSSQNSAAKNQDGKSSQTKPREDSTQQPGDQNQKPDGKAKGNAQEKPQDKPDGNEQQPGKPNQQGGDDQKGRDQNDMNPVPSGGEPAKGKKPDEDKPTQKSKEQQQEQSGEPIKNKKDGPSPGENSQPSGGQGNSDKQRPKQGEENTQGKPSGGKGNQGAPAPQQNSASNGSKSPTGSEKTQGNDAQGDAQSPSTSSRPSDAKGQEDGDRSGNGNRGGGQKSDQPGNGMPGKNTPGDEGAGKSNEPGKGDASNQPGNDQKSGDRTGQSGNDKGNGSASRKTDSAKDQQPNDGTKSSDPTSGAPRPRDRQNPNDYQEQPKGTSRGGADSRGGIPSGDYGSPPEAQPTKPDDPNLNYAKKATELALDYLKNAMKNGKDGQELLNQLGWSRAEAEQFIQRQEQRLRNAERPNSNDEAKREAEDALRSLGLRPSRTTHTGESTSDNQRGLSAGRRTAPPPEYQEQYRAYQQGINRGSGQ